MTKDQEKQLLQAIYDRLFDAITYQPRGGVNPFTESETFIHFSKNAALDPTEFADPVTPSNPNGNMRASEAFSRMVNYVSPMEIEWNPSESHLSSTYKLIVDSANAIIEHEDPKAKEMYDKAYNYLHPETTTVNPFTGESVTERTDSADYVAYEENMEAYVSAIAAYRLQYNVYLDALEDPDPAVRKKADRDWQAKAPVLEMAIKSAFRKLQAGNAKYVEQALMILATTLNDGIRRAIMMAQEGVADDRAFSSSMGLPDKWFLSYPVPGNWTDESQKSFTELHISGGQTDIRNKATEHNFSMDTSLNYGLWKVKASAGGNYEHRSSTTEKDSVEISAKICRVQVMRPWFTDSLFRLANWTTDLCGAGGISNGKIDSSNRDRLMPIYPVAFVVAKDITIKAAFSKEDIDIINESYNAGTSVGWGPFAIGGSYGYGNSEKTFHSEFQNGELKVPGMQILAWISRVVPLSTR